MFKSFKRILSIFVVLCLIVSIITIKPSHVNAVVKNDRGGISPGGSFFQMSDAKLDTFLDDFETTNASYIRLDIAWNVVQPNNSTTWDFSAYDRVINAVIDRGLKILAMPTFAPAWANGGYSDNKYPPTTAHVNDWYNFVKACGDQYIPLGVDAWEIWNEPNINGFWKPVANVADYTNNVLKPGANAIRTSAAALSKSVTVITGGLSPAATNGTNISPLDFVTGIYANGGKNYFDAIGHHPYSFPEGPYSTSTYSAFQQTISINQIMVNNNDGSKKIWGTELGWHTGDPADGGVTEAVQAQYVTEAYERWNSWSFTGPLIWHTYEDWGTDYYNREHNFGLKRYNGTFKPGWQAFINVMNSTIPPSGQILFSTGFETVEIQPTWSNFVQYVNNVSGYTSGINPECSIRINEQAHTGATSLMFSGSDNSTVSSYCVYKVFDVNIPISSNTELSYWFYPQQENARHVLIDIVCTDGSDLTSTAAVDQNNIGYHPSNARGTINTWNEVSVNMGQWLNGKTIDYIQVCYDQGPATGQYRGYIDDIKIQN